MLKGRQAYMHQNLLNAEFASGEYRNAGDKNMYVIRVMKALTKELACREAFAAYMPAVNCIFCSIS